MEVLMTRVRIAFIVVGLAMAGPGAAAGTVTYEFIMANSVPDAAAVAFLEFTSPASATQGWSTSSSADVLSFEIADGFLAPVGPYTPTITSEVVSSTGATLNHGTITGTNGFMEITADFSSFAFPVTLVATPEFGASGAGKSVFGEWVVFGSSIPDPSAIPEPFAIIPGVTAALAGLVLWSRRRLRREKVARDGRSVGHGR
jgi:hypothetical protein